MEVLLAVDISVAPILAEVLSEEPRAVEVLIALSEEGAEEPQINSRLLEVSMEEQEVVPEMEMVASCSL